MKAISDKTAYLIWLVMDGCTAGTVVFQQTSCKRYLKKYNGNFTYTSYNVIIFNNTINYNI